ncbi:ornithine carbamoyltransferase [bacterium]|nr:ornithine carbamoyltransferase [bacterium]
MKRDVLVLRDLTAKEITAIIARGIQLKKNKKPLSVLKGRVLGLIFEKESTRTRISFEVAMTRLGGSVVYIGQNSSQLSRGETYADTARVLSRYLDGLVLRTFSQEGLNEMAIHADIPIINGLTDDFHPCQLLADLMTITERKKGKLSNCAVAYVGDGNNMANTWIEAAMLLKFYLRLACPQGYYPQKSLLDEASQFSNISITTNPQKAVEGAEFINTDTWFSMGQEVSNEKRAVFAPFQVNKNLLSYAKKDALVMHCLPAHRDEEITSDVLDGQQSIVFDEAENRLYAQMALLEFLMKRKK